MKNTCLGLLLFGLFASPGHGQERDEAASSPKREAAEREEAPRGARRERRDYGRGAMQLKVPAEFAAAQEKQVFSGPQPGEELPPLSATSVWGESEGKSIDVLRLAGDRPHVLLLMDDNGVGLRGMYGFTRLADQVARRANADLQVSVVFLSDDPATVTRFAENVGGGLGDKLDVLAISPDGRDGPGAYGLNRNVSQTILFAKGGVVQHNFVFLQGMLYPDPHVLGALAAAVGEDRETVAGWLNEAPEEGARMQAPREGDSDAAARQVALRERLGAFVEAGKLTREEAVELYRIAFPDSGRRERERRESEQ